MVKGVARRVVVVKSPDPKQFEQAIFLLREDAISGEAPEEQVLRLKKRIRHLVILWLITLLLLAATIYPTVEFFTGKTLLLPGQNYTAITENSSDTP